LSIEGLFPDNYTKREIDEQKVACLNTGCNVTIPLLEADQHYASCRFNKNQVSFLNDYTIVKINNFLEVLVEIFTF